MLKTRLGLAVTMQMKIQSQFQNLETMVLSQERGCQSEQRILEDDSQVPSLLNIQ